MILKTTFKLKPLLVALPFVLVAAPFFSLPTPAQVKEYDEVYPMGASQNILQGHAKYDENGNPLYKKRHFWSHADRAYGVSRIKHRDNYDDGLAGKTIQINIGGAGGGAFAYP